MDRHSLVGKATRYGLDDPGSNPAGNDVIRTRPDRPWGSPNLLYKKYPVSSPGYSGRGVALTTPTPSSAEVKERVELCF
jgi:hypothetical protein